MSIRRTIQWRLTKETAKERSGGIVEGFLIGGFEKAGPDF